MESIDAAFDGKLMQFFFSLLVSYSNAIVNVSVLEQQMLCSMGQKFLFF